jgi:glycogen debranching enzyme
LSPSFSNDHINDATCCLEVSTAGSFEYFVKVGGQRPPENASGFFLIEPDLVIQVEGKEPKRLPIDGIVLQTFIPKWLGPLRGWDPHFQACAKSGYNMVHFAPMQERGGSNSPYSLSNQLSFASELFEGMGTLDDSQKFDKVYEFVNRMERSHGLLSMTDIVLNHTSFDSPWLQEHPEAGNPGMGRLKHCSSSLF